MLNNAEISVSYWDGEKARRGSTTEKQDVLLDMYIEHREAYLVEWDTSILAFPRLAVVGKYTIHNMQNGAVYGSDNMVFGMYEMVGTGKAIVYVI